MRALYHDWCTAHLAERFLRLTPGEVYELAEEAARRRADETAAAGGAPIPPAAAASGQDALSGTAGRGAYREVVGSVAGLLRERMGLPSFEAWAAAYEADPAAFDREILGFGDR